MTSRSRTFTPPDTLAPNGTATPPGTTRTTTASITGTPTTTRPSTSTDPQGGFFTQLFKSMALGSGGRQIENAIWDNALSDISMDCSTAPTLP
jgi:hypothetical protein